MCFTCSQNQQRKKKKIYRVYPEPPLPSFTTDEIIQCAACEESFNLLDIKINCAGCNQFFHFYDYDSILDSLVNCKGLDLLTMESVL